MAEANIPELKVETEGENSDGNKENTNINMNSEDAKMQKFLEKSRSELMFELRRLQHGDRPVTGQGHKEMVNEFFSKRLQVASATNDNENVPSNVDAVEEHRPEAVVVEVQGLYEQHRVSAMLQSQQFRRQLENIIRGSVAAAPRRQQPIANPRRQQQPVAPTRRQSVLLRDNPPPTALRPDTHSSDESSPSAWSDQEEEPTPTAAPRTSPAQNRSRQSFIHDQPIVSDTGLGISWNQISEVQQEDLITEIRELVHQRLVSSTLNGQFRGTLEVTMQNRVPENGADVAEFIRSIEPTQHIRRNDYSNLGIGDADENLDSLSVTSISAHAVPYTHSNLHLGREISSLKTQMVEMKNMMKLSFDLQMDIQRAIRQEVAAAMNSVAGTSNTAVIPETKSVKDDKCVICLDNYSETVLYQCGHMCLCYKCGKDLQNRGLNCPVCRAPIRDIIKAYRCNKQ